MIYELIVKGLKSTQAIEESLRQRLQNLLETAPSDSSASAQLKKGHKGYEGLIEIFSSQGRFVAQAVRGNFNELVQVLTKDIQKQIRQWRGYRFVN